MSNKDLKRMIKNYYDKLCYIHPLIGSPKFMEISNQRWACLELLRELDNVDNLPFYLTPIELLQNFSEKMKLYAGKNEKACIPFLEANNVAEYFIEECWKTIANNK